MTNVITLDQATMDALRGKDGLPGRDGAAGPAGPAGSPGIAGKDGLPGPAGKDGVSPTIDMTALAKAVAAILAGTPTTGGGTTTNPPGGGTTTPPVGNNLQVSGKDILNPDGTVFTPFGWDICHYDSSWKNGLQNSGANAARIFLPGNDLTKWAPNILAMQAMKIVPIACMAGFPSGAGTSGNNSATDLASGVQFLVNNAATLKGLFPMILNIANEWLSGVNPTLWKSSYIDAITKLRAAGYTQPLMIDTDGYGQDYSTLASSAAAVRDADPLKNVCFGYHLYGQTPDVATMNANFAKLEAPGICVVVAEYGPGRNIGPSPTSITPQAVEQACVANNLGSIAWAWDDNNLANAKADDNWFSATTGNPGGVGAYDGSNQAQLTQFGQAMVPIFKAVSKPSTAFK